MLSLDINHVCRAPMMQTYTASSLYTHAPKLQPDSDISRKVAAILAIFPRQLGLARLEWTDVLDVHLRGLQSELKVVLLPGSLLNVKAMSRLRNEETAMDRCWA